jgi:hypothetical protein
MLRLHALLMTVVFALYVEVAGAGFQLVEPEPAPEPANDETDYPSVSSRPLASGERVSLTEKYRSIDNRPVEMTTNGIRHIGYADIDPGVVGKSGRSVPLPMALKKVLPPGWHAKKTVDIESSMPITWSSGWDWVTTLEDIAKYHHIQFTVDWNSQTVTVEPASGHGKERLASYEEDKETGETTAEQSKSLLRPAVYHKADAKAVLTKYSEPEVESREEEEEEKLPGNEAKAVTASYKPPAKLTEADIVEPVIPKSSVKPPPTVVFPIKKDNKEDKSDPPPQPPFPTYTIASGETLRTVLTRWTGESGWDLVWEPTNDFSLGAGATFHGDMKVAIAGLMESLRDSGAPFGAEMWNGNRVVRVVRVR